MKQTTYDEANEREGRTNRLASKAGVRGGIGGALFGFAIGLASAGLMALVGVGLSGGLVGALAFSTTMATVFGFGGFAAGRASVISFERGRKQGLQEAGVGQALSNELGLNTSREREAEPEVRRERGDHASRIEQEREKIASSVLTR